jgi:hypothetical protein
MSGLIHTGLGSSSLIAHVLHSPPPPPVNSFVIGPAVINTHPVFTTVVRELVRKWLSTKNRSIRRSTPRHPITMASTVESPDPMTCALAAILLPESCAHGCHMQKTLFPGTYWVHTGECVLGPFLRVGYASVGARRESGQQHGCGEDVPDAAGGRRALVGSPLHWHGHVRVVFGRSHGGLVDVVSSSSAGSGMRGRLGWCGVRWLFRGFYAGHRLGHGTATA